MYHPPRGGVRGGRDQFNWEDVKTDKHRENYLGHSLHAPVGRWQQGKDLTWYSKESKNDQARKEEIKSIKEAEAEAMAELLGGGKRRKITGNVSQQELKTVLKREQEGYDDDGGGIGEEEEIKEITKGLGFKSSGHLSIGEVELGDTEIIGAVNIPKDERKVEIKTEESIHPNLKKSAVRTTDEQKVSKKRKKDKDKERGRERGKERDKERGKERDKERGKERDKERDKEREKEKKKHKKHRSHRKDKRD